MSKKNIKNIKTFLNIKNIKNNKNIKNIKNFKTIFLKIFITAIYVTSHINCLSENKTEIGNQTVIENEQNNNNENGEKFIETPVCLENQILEENKCIDTYNLIFDTKDGNLIEIINNIKAGDIINLPIPVKAGYVFKYWSLNGNFEVEFPFTMPNDNVTLIANWELVNNIIVFDTNGGVSLSSLINLTFGQEINIMPTPQYLGYEFKGWFIVEDDLGKSEKPVIYPFKIATKYNLLKAKWQFIPYTIYFNTNGGENINNKTNLKVDSIVSLPTPIKKGYTFLGWQSIVNVFPTGVVESSSISGASGGGGLSSNALETSAVTNSTISGTSGDGINTADGAGPVILINTNNFIMPANNVTLVAWWSINYYTLSYDTNGGLNNINFSNINHLTFGQKISLNYIPIKTGYTFLGWQSIVNVFPAGIVKSPSISGASGGGDLLSNALDASVVTNSTISGASGGGISTAGLAGPVLLINPINFIMPANNVTLVAWWSINYYTISYDTNGGSNNINFSNINHLTFRQKISLNYIPIKTGYTFLGWQSIVNVSPAGVVESPSISGASGGGGLSSNALDASVVVNSTISGASGGGINTLGGTGPVVLINTNKFIIPANNVTLIAWWSINYYTLNFDLGDTESNTNFTNIEHITFGQTLTINKVPTLTNYSFTGWSFDGKSIGNTINFPPKNSTLKATWKCNLNKVDCDNDGLIEIYSISDLDKIRFNLEGTSWRTSLTDIGTSSGCPIKDTTNNWMSINGEVCRGYELMNNINFTGSKWESGGVDESWLPIGTFVKHFSATFEGNGFTISNLYIKNKKSDFQGLFNITNKSAVIKNLGLVDLFIIAQNIAGGLVGSNSGKIENCFAKGIILSSENIENTVAWQSIDSVFMGGLVGLNDGVIENSFAEVSITGKEINKTFIGGLVGYQNDGIVMSSYSIGHVSNAIYIGGLIGQLWGTVYNSYSSGNVYGGGVGSNVGGLVGFLGNGYISNSYASGNVEYGGNVGGLVGQSWASIYNSYSLGNVFGNETSIIGGLIGQLQGSVENSYSKSNVTGKIFNNRKSINGGLVGLFESGLINKSYALGIVIIGGNVGGLVGNQKANTLITNSFAKGIVSGSGSVGGLVGLSYSTITNSFANGNVYSQSDYASIGALIGNQNQNALSMNNFASGDVDIVGNDCYVGGLVGYQYNSKIENNYYIGNIKSSGNSCNVGGLVGNTIKGRINKTYTVNSFNVTGFRIKIGGIVGALNNGSITNTFWDKIKSEILIGVGFNNNEAGGDVGVGLLTCELFSTSNENYCTNQNNMLNPSLLGACFKFNFGNYPKLFVFENEFCGSNLVEDLNFIE